MLNANYQHWFSDYHVFTKTKSYGYFCFALRYMMFDNNLNISIVATDPFRQLSLEQLKDNLELTGEILKDGIRIYC